MSFCFFCAKHGTSCYFSTLFEGLCEIFRFAILGDHLINNKIAQEPVVSAARDNTATVKTTKGSEARYLQI